MSVDSIQAAQAAMNSQPATQGSAQARMDFMELLVAQIQNQDPLSPMDNAQFTSQITEFTMLEEMEQINSTLEENLLIGQSLNNTSMLALVGKQVTVQGDSTWCQEGTATESIVISEGPGVATIEVKDASGHVVATYQKNVTQGMNEVTWDGCLDGGGVAEDGEYSLSVTVENGDRTLETVTLMTGSVEGIRFDNNVAVVIVGGQEFYVSEVYKVS